MKRAGVAIGAFALLAALPAWAAESTIDFEGAVIEGAVAAPAGVRLESRTGETFEPMLFERTSFRDEMADALPEVDERIEKAPVRLAQAGTVDPCRDEIYVSLKAKSIEALSDREFEIFKAKDQACNEARVRTVATPAPAPSPTATPPTVVVPPGGEFQPAPAPEPQPAPRRFGQPWGAKELLLLMFGGVALLLLMMGGMLLLLAVLAG